MPISDIVAKAAKETVDGIMNGLDGLITSKEELKTIESELTKDITGKIKDVVGYQTDIILAEAKGSKLQRNWRPILALSFGFIVISTYFTFPIINLWLHNAELHALILELKDNTGFWSLMQLMIGGYVVSRGIEKVASTVTSNEPKEKKGFLGGIFKKKNKEE